MKAMLIRSLAPSIRPADATRLDCAPTLAAESAAAETATSRVRKSRRVEPLPAMCRVSFPSALFREQLLQFVHGHSAAVLAEFEALGMLDLLSLFGAIALF